ncbi:hypothetical protein, partial [Klebsiella pneumoniae]|uniref:hypothetical protein n=1 Tax=Klebsiella pneumoniae TaxID=573 RepID=UPI0019537F14
EAEDLAPAYVEVEALEHGAVAKAHDEVAHADQRVRTGTGWLRGQALHGAQKSMAAKNTAKSPSSMITMKID